MMFLSPEWGKATPLGIYTRFEHHGLVSVGMSAETAEFAVEGIRNWRYAEGISAYAGAA
jgi:hypothetical protein